MPDGPGKYDDLATHVREQTQAQGVILVVLGGNRGHGFELLFEVNESPRGMYLMLRAQAKVIKQVADEIEAQALELRQKHGAAW